MHSLLCLRSRAQKPTNQESSPAESDLKLLNSCCIPRLSLIIAIFQLLFRACGIYWVNGGRGNRNSVLAIEPSEFLMPAGGGISKQRDFSNYES